MTTTPGTREWEATSATELRWIGFSIREGVPIDEALRLLERLGDPGPFAEQRGGDETPPVESTMTAVRTGPVLASTP